MLPPPKPTTSTERSFVLPEGCTEVLHLMGASGLADFLAFARDHTQLAALSSAGGDSVMMELAESWRDAARTFDALKATDPFPVEPPQVFPIPTSMQAHCDTLLSQPDMQRAFDRVPIALGMVPLAQLICLRQRVPVSARWLDVFSKVHLADDALIATCLPLQPAPHAVEVVQQTNGQHAGSVTFAADSDDLCALPLEITGAMADALPEQGHRAVTWAVGYPTRLFNVIRFEDRIALNNGYQRALAMYRSGVTHVPAIIHVCRHWEDVGLVLSAGSVAHREACFEHARPPMLKDFSDRRLAISLAVRRARKFVRISYQVETGHMVS